MPSIFEPPSYCPDAIATDVGWINPKNGELLVSVRGLRQHIQNQQHVQYKSLEADVKSDTQQVLDRLTDITVAQPKEDDRSDTHKILDLVTTISTPTEDLRSDTQKVLDVLTEQQKAVTIVNTNKPTETPEVPKKGRGRPKKGNK